MPHYAFIIGANQDWPEQRCSLGDIGLARCLSDHCHLIPTENLVEVYDDEATRSNILRALDSLLDRRNTTNNNKSNNQQHQQQDEALEEEEDTLLFYYGGHGKETEFCTSHGQSIHKGEIRREPWIKHGEIVDLLERKFKGGTAWCIIDTCHSGGFGEAVVQRHQRAHQALAVNYGCIMSVPPADEAGMEWSLSECFIRAFKGELFCSRNEKDCYYLSTKKGIHPNKTSVALLRQTNGFDHCGTTQNEGTYHPTWEQVIEYLSDEMARIKGDRLTTLFLGKGMKEILRKQCNFGDNIIRDTVSNNTTCIPRDESWMDPFRRKCLAVNDGVYVKWVGYSASCSLSDDDNDNMPCSIARIGWFPGRIISISPPCSKSSVYDCSAEPTGNENEKDTSSHQSTACIELYDAICKSHWTINLPLVQSSPPSSPELVILGGLPFGFGFDPRPCIKVITHMARHLAYFDTSLPPNMHVKVMCDGEFYTAKTLCRNEIQWDEVDLECLIEMMVGPCVPLRWEEDDSISFVSTHHCVLQDIGLVKGCKKKRILLAEKSARDTVEIMKTPMEAMMASLECEGKKLNEDSLIFDGLVSEEDADFWEAYDGEACRWESVQLMNTVDPSVVPLQALAHHMCYRESENFSLVYWESDSTLALVPNSCLRQRSTADHGSVEGVIEEECSDEAADREDVRRCVDEFCYKFDDDPLEDQSSPSKRSHFELGSLAVVLIGLGFIAGSRSRR